MIATMNNMITRERSSQICKHMNDDHHVSVYAMALSSIPASQRRTIKLQNVKMKSVSMKEYIISYNICVGDLCGMTENISIPFNPPLSSPSEVRLRLVEDHHKYLTPELKMLFLDPFCLVVLITTMLLGYGTLFMGIDKISSLTTTSSLKFAYAVQYAFITCVVLHGLEAMYIVYLCKKVLKLKLYSCFKTFCIVSCVGFPMTKYVLGFVWKQRKQQQQQKQEKSD